MASKIDMMREGINGPKDEPKISGVGVELKKSKKPMAMSLQAFNNMNLNGEVPGDTNDTNVKDSFFEDVDEASKIALNREQIRESLQQRYSVSASNFWSNWERFTKTSFEFIFRFYPMRP